MGSGMNCPECGHEKSRINGQSWHNNDGGGYRYRRRTCYKCEHKFTTYEVYEGAAGKPQKLTIKARTKKMAVQPGEYVAQYTRPTYGRIIKAFLAHHSYDDIAVATGYQSKNSIAKAILNIRRDIAGLRDKETPVPEIAKCYGISEVELEDFLGAPSRKGPPNSVAIEIERLSQIVDEDGNGLTAGVIRARMMTMGFKTTLYYIHQVQREMYIDGKYVPRLEAACQKNPSRYTSITLLRNLSQSATDGGSQTVNGRAL
jgi:hypothetical protein